MTKKNNKPVNDVILERAQSVDWDNLDDTLTFHSGMSSQEINRKFWQMVKIAKQSKGK